MVSKYENLQKNQIYQILNLFNLKLSILLLKSIRHSDKHIHMQTVEKTQSVVTTLLDKTILTY